MIEKSGVLAIGCGGCGNNQLNTFMDLDLRYTGIFMNTNRSEMENLSNFDDLRRSFYIPNADGTGKQREIAEEYIMEESPKFVEQIIKYSNQPMVIFYASMDGGTGSKAIILLSKFTKQWCPEKSINLVVTFPSMNEGEVSYRNTIDTWNEILDLKRKNIINSIQFIDNNKYDQKDINMFATKDIDESFDLIGGNIDSSDLEKAQTSKGYKVMLKLDESIKDVDKAIDNAIKESCFYMPENWECDIVLGSINTTAHNLKEIKDKFDAFDINKFNTKTEGDSFILLGGCEIPTEPIQLMKECLKEIRKRKKDRIVQEDLEVDTNWNKNNTTKSPNPTRKSKLSSNDLKKMFADDNFWK